MFDKLIDKWFEWWNGLEPNQRKMFYIASASVIVIIFLIILLLAINWDKARANNKANASDIADTVDISGEDEGGGSDGTSGEDGASSGETKGAKDKLEAGDIVNVSNDQVTIVSKVVANNCNHEWQVFGNPTEATCTDKGLTSVRCTHCGAEGYLEQPELMHRYSDSSYKVIKEPTCKEHGQVEYTCDRCGEHIKEITPFSEHNFSSTYEIDKQPTCTAAGQKSRKCEFCNKTTDSVAIPPLSHEFITTVVQPTCETAGYTLMKCKFCNFENKVPISATGHKHGEKVTDLEATCVTNGERSRHCSVCGIRSDKEVVTAFGHDWTEWTKTEATCTASGFQSRKCKRCGLEEKQETLAKGHDWETIKTEAGVYYKCRDCGFEDAMAHGD